MNVKITTEGLNLKQKKGNVMKTKQRFLAFLLSLALIVTYMPAMAFAATEGDAAADAPAAEEVADEAAETAEANDEAEQPESAEAEAQAGEPAPEAEAAGVSAEATEEPAAADKDAEAGQALKLVSAGTAHAVPGEDIAGNDELVENFFDQKVDEALGGKQKSGMLKAARNTRRSKLNVVEKQVYDKLLAEVQSIAEGRQADTKISIDLTSELSDYLVDSDVYSNCPKAITYDSLGMQGAMGVYVPYEYEDENGQTQTYWDFSDEAREKLYDIGKVVNAVMADHPQYMYWFDKTAGYSYGLNAGLDTSDEAGSDLYFTGDPILSVSFTVAQGYRGEGGQYSFDTTKAAGLEAAAAKATQILAEVASEGGTDVDKLTAFKDAVCGLTSYNDEAASNTDTPYGDPWQLIWVFDGDETTNVVCEGYSKAFQYLCDKANFSDSRIECHTVSGDMGGGTGAGPHMWNILHMDDNRNYIADITNSDADSAGENGELFLTAAMPYDSYESFSYDCGGTSINYVYDPETLSQYDESELTMSTEAYDGPTEPANPERAVEYWSFSKADGETPKIQENDGDYGYFDEDLGYFVYQFDNELMFDNGDTLTVKYEDEAEELTYTFYGYDEDKGLEQCFARETADGWERIDYSEITGSLNDANGDAIQTEAWTAGTEGCQFRLLYNGVEFMLPFEIVENPESSLSFSREGYDAEHPVELMEDVDGQRNADDNLFWYNIKFREGDVLTVNGVAYTYQATGFDAEIAFVNEKGDKITDYDIEQISNDSTWDPGDYTITLRYNGASCDVNVRVVANPIQELSFERPGTEGAIEIPQITGDGYYSFNFKAGDILRIKYLIDDAIYDIDYVYFDEERGDEWVMQFEAAETVPEGAPEVILGYDVNGIFYGNEEEGDPETWALGDIHEINMEYYGRSCKVPVKLVEGEDPDEPEGPAWHVPEDYVYARYDIGSADRVELTAEVDFSEYDEAGLEHPELSYAWNSQTGSGSWEGQTITVDPMGMTYFCTVTDGDGNEQYITYVVYPNASRIEYTPSAESGTVEIPEKSKGSIMNEGTDEEYFDYALDHVFKEGDRLTVYKTADDSEGTVYEYREAAVYNTIGQFFVNTENSSDIIATYGLSSNQSSDNPWLLNKPEGAEYYLYFSIGELNVADSLECEIPVTIVENPVKSISYSTEQSFIENRGGSTEYDEDGNAYYNYSTGFHEGDTLTVNDTAYVYQYNEDRDESGFFNGDEMLEGVDFYDNQYNDHWVIPEGEEEAAFPVTIEYMGASCEVEITVTKNPVTGISFTPVEEYAELTEDVDVYVEDTDGEEWFRYDVPFFQNGDTLTVSYYNKEDATYVYDSEEGFFINQADSSDRIDAWRGYDEYGVCLIDDQSAKNPWTVNPEGDYYQTEVSYMGQTTGGRKIRILANPVSSISFSRNGGDLIQLIQGKDSDKEWREDPETGERVPYDYYYFGFELGDVLTVNRSDDSSEEYEYRRIKEGRYYENRFVNVEDESDILSEDDLGMYSKTSQEANPWQVGGIYPAEVRYFGKTTAVRVEIKANPITAISYKFADGSDTISLIDGVDGYMDTGWVTINEETEEEKEVEYFYYESPEFKVGDRMTVTKDGKMNTYEFRNSVFNGEYYTGAFVNISENASEDDVIYEDEVDRYSNNQSAENPWVLGGEGYSFTYKYYGFEFSVPAEIEANTVSGIDFEREGYDAEHPIELTEGLDAEINSDGGNNVWFEYYLRFKNGDKIKVTDAGNTSEYNAVAYSEEDNDARYFEDSEGNRINMGWDHWNTGRYLTQSSDQSKDNVWKAGDTHTIDLKYYAQTKGVNVKIKKNLVQSLEFVRPGSDRVELVENGDGYADERYFHYEINFKPGDEIYVTYDGVSEPVKYVAVADTDGKVNEFVTDEQVPEGANDYISYSDLEFRHNSERYIAYSDDPYLMLMYKGMYTNVPVQLVENKVEDIEFVWAAGGDAVELVENKDGGEAHYYDNDLGDRTGFEYQLPYKDGDMLKVKYTGTDEPVAYEYDSESKKFVASGSVPEGFASEIPASDIQQRSNQSYEVQWELGDEATMVLTYMGSVFSVPVRIVEGTDTPQPGNVTVALHPEADGQPRTIVVDELSKEMNFPEDGDTVTADGVTYIYDSATDSFNNESDKVYWTFEGTDSDYDEDTDTYTYFIIVSFESDNGESLGECKIENVYGNEITGMEFVPNGKTELIASEIETGDGYDLNQRGGGDFFVEGDKILLENKFNGKTTTYTFTWDSITGDFKCEGYGWAPTYAYWENAVVGDNEVRIEMLDGTAYTTIKIVDGSAPVCEHELTATAAKAATCETAGNSAYWTCSKCSKYFSDAEGKNEIAKDSWVIAALGHDWGEWTVTKAATCTEKGEEQRVCGHDESHVEKRDIAAKGHTVEVLQAVPATCTEDGLTEGKKCSVCNEIIVPQYKIAALGHDWSEWKVTREATCTAAGEEQRVCSHDSSHVDIRAIESKGHTPAEKVTENWKAATCTEAGSYDEVTYCSVCKNEISRVTRTVAALGHNWGDWKSVDENEHQRVCSLDGTHVEKAAHAWDGGKVTAVPSVEAEGEITFTCPVCGKTKTEVIPKLAPSAIDGAIAEAETKIDDAADLAAEADKKADTSTDEGDVSEAENAAAEAAASAAAVEAAATEALEQAQKTLSELPADATAADKAVAEANVANAEKNLEVAKQLKLAATSTVTKSKRAAAKVASNKATAAVTTAAAAENTTDDSKAAEAVSVADAALAAAEAAEAAAQSELDALNAAGASTEEKDAATKSLAEAKKITAAAYSAKASAKKSAAVVASNRAAEASEAAKNTTDPAQAEQYRKQAAEEAAKAESLAGEAKEASTAASTAAEEIKTIADTITDPAVKEEAGKAASEASSAAAEASSAATDAGKAQDAAKESSTSADESVADRIGTPMIKLSKTAFTYKYKVKTVKKTQKAVATAQKPTVTVTLNGKAVSTDNYDVAYSNEKSAAIGQYTVTVTLKGQYSGSATATYTINPKAVKLKKVAKGKKMFTASWAKLSKNDIKFKAIDGYQIRYATKSNFSGAKTISAGTRTAVKKVVKKLKGKKKYYVQLRTYKKVKGVTGGKLFSAWSAKKTVTTSK